MQHGCCTSYATCFHLNEVILLKFFAFVQHYDAEKCYNCVRMMQGCFTVCNITYGT